MTRKNDKENMGIILVVSLLVIVIFFWFLPTFIPTGNTIIRTECLEQGWDCMKEPCQYLLRCYEFYFDEMLIGRGNLIGMKYLNETWVSEQPEDGLLFINERKMVK